MLSSPPICIGWVFSKIEFSMKTSYPQMTGNCWATIPISIMDAGPRISAAPAPILVCLPLCLLKLLIKKPSIPSRAKTSLVVYLQAGPTSQDWQLTFQIFYIAQLYPFLPWAPLELEWSIVRQRTIHQRTVQSGLEQLRRAQARRFNH